MRKLFAVYYIILYVYVHADVCAEQQQQERKDLCGKAKRMITGQMKNMDRLCAFNKRKFPLRLHLASD